MRRFTARRNIEILLYMGQGGAGLVGGGGGGEGSLVLGNPLVYLTATQLTICWSTVPTDTSSVPELPLPAAQDTHLDVRQIWNP